jgi:hypothetical protein
MLEPRSTKLAGASVVSSVVTPGRPNPFSTTTPRATTSVGSVGSSAVQPPSVAISAPAATAARTVRAMRAPEWWCARRARSLRCIEFTVV